MDSAVVFERLTQHRALGGSPPEELSWLATRGALRVYHAGDITTRKHEPEESLQVVLSGQLAIYTDRGAGARKIIAWRGGDVCGLMPYSRGGRPPGDTVAEETTETLAIPRDLLPAMIRECPGVTATLVHAMLDRARHLTSSELQDEKLLSLGKLAAGLAHELNNPASAAARSAKLLARGLTQATAAARAVAGAQLSDAQLAAIDLGHTIPGMSGSHAPQSPLDRADREEAIGGWLDSHGCDNDIAAVLAEAGVDPTALDAVAAVLHGGVLRAAVQWIAAEHLVRTLALDIETSTTRVYDLVAAVKGFTYMDHAPMPEAVDIRRGIADTLTVLGARAREKSVSIEVDIATDLPPVRGIGAELNQVWANLLDNALDAVAVSGRVVVTASRTPQRVVVQIVDDGPGVPPGIQGRIFDPFFTTKEVGRGVGLGLDIVRRLLQRNDGEIALDSRPGRTAFRVSLPLDTTSGHGVAAMGSTPAGGAG